ncbi:MAG: 23S rRNA (guanosine(2251)-2'-O)-methyltransferase RlmB [Anaeroplasmataceae bacterium]|nr:23S rRNA (guanosine(2251)-2'-O)-methyltransferase RlmB [Anaeroplasmataceae bacterium]MDE6414003.1 23S rRNA (guanosine(2251)-2'-O)-methyltransferase RlmB [Anaeroplasmataceae bacterium]
MIKIYGKNCIREAIRANGELQEVFIQDEISKKDTAFLELLKDKKIKYNLVPKQKMDTIFGTGHQGYGAYHKDYTIYGEDIIDYITQSPKRVLLLDGIMDPHNLGAILRSVDAFGYDAVVLPKNRSCSITETVAHVSTGAIEHVKIAYVNSLSAFVERLKKADYWICGTDAKGNTDVAEVDLSLNLAVIIGSEGFGMSRTLVKQTDYLISIPMVGHVNSLNASVSTGIILYALKR